ncbi:MAG: LysE family transporter [Verrucomicrobiota bacterium]
MEQLHLLQTLLAGMGCGFIVSVPVGPVNLTVINNALRKGFRPAFLAGLGAIVAESFYAALMLAGHSSLLDQSTVSWVLRIVAVVVMAGMGVRSLLAKPEPFETQSAATAERADERWHHPQTFLLGFVLTISNLMLVLLWATLAALLFAREWVDPGLLSRSVCVAGVFTGGAVWFFLLAFFVSRAHHRVKPRTLTLFVRACGVVLLVCAGLLAYRLVVPVKKLPAVDLLHNPS